MTVEEVVKFIFTHTELWERPDLDSEFKLKIVPNEPRWYSYKFPYRYETWVEAIKKGKEMNDQVIEQAVSQEQPQPSVEPKPEEPKHNNGTPAPQDWEANRQQG